ncbi:TrmB family transcriptional regulator [Thermofilum pendens]|uniref:Transcriptional regulator, TrmB n=1 Tax=Thermofilum pendens (strain DSM 2475 / Hrk 5) TaxID=368408 RepID=A1RZC2_THEPD|nr:TrmB family transcriptional regulator [Thermofilum pendens]ABL78552.1 transcriptional regulator, TrmB [Thermofilum pendens Hrk 5]
MEGAELSLKDLYRLAESLGLREYEARAYIALVLYGSMTATELAKRSELPQPRVYDVVKALEEKGLVAISEGKPRKFSALDPRVALKRYVERRHAEETSTLNSILRLLESASLRREEPGVWTAVGQNAGESLFLSALESARHELLVAGYSKFLRGFLDRLARTDLATCLVLYDGEDIGSFVNVFDEVRLRPTRAPQMAIPDFSQVVIVSGWESGQVTAYKVTDDNLMRIFAVYYLDYLRGSGKVVAAKFGQLERRTYHHMTRALEHINALLGAGRKPVLTVRGRWVATGEEATVRGVPVRLFENSFRSVGTILLKLEDGREVSVGGVGAYLEDVEAYEITVEARE